MQRSPMLPKTRVRVCGLPSRRGGMRDPGPHLGAGEPTSLARSNPSPDAIVAKSSPEPRDLFGSPVGDHVEHDFIQGIGKAQILESVLPKQRPKEIGQAAVPASLGRGAGDLPPPIRGESPSPGSRPFGATQSAQGNRVGILHTKDCTSIYSSVQA